VARAAIWTESRRPAIPAIIVMPCAWRSTVHWARKTIAASSAETPVTVSSTGAARPFTVRTPVTDQPPGCCPGAVGAERDRRMTAGVDEQSGTDLGIRA
jgi:hypothetical protein